MAWLLLLALLPLDVTAPAPPPALPRAPAGPRLLIAVEGRHVVARLLNDGPRRLKLYLGELCSGPTPFEAVIDGVAHPFVEPRDCDKNPERTEWLRPGRELRVASATELLDEAQHRVVVRYHAARRPLEHDLWRGDLESAPALASGSLLSVSVRVLDPEARAARAITVEIRHEWHGPRRLRFLTGWRGACAQAQDTVLVDGAPAVSPDVRACDGPAEPAAEELAPGAAFTTHVQVSAPLGRRELRVVYHVDAKEAAMIDRADNMGVWSGTAESPTMVVDGPP